MNRPLTQILVAACITFTAFMAVSLAFAYAFIGPNYGLNIALGLLITSFIVAFFQVLWFTEAFIKQLSYAVRLIGFGFSFAPVLFAIAWFFQWFPLEPLPITIFFAIYLLIFGVTALGYTIYFRKTAGSYSKALELYRQKQKDGTNV